MCLWLNSLTEIASTEVLVAATSASATTHFQEIGHSLLGIFQYHHQAWYDFGILDKKKQWNDDDSI